MIGHPLHLQWLRRRKRLRRLLRMLPRRANVGRYPVIRRFADAARARPYLWSFKRENVLPALYVGSVLAFMPTYGVQVLLAFVAAMFVRANLTVIVGLQMITNPITAAPAYLLTYEVGDWLISHTGYGAGGSEFGAGVNALILGGLVVGAASAFLIDLSWRLLAWEAKMFSRKLAELRARHAAELGTPPAKPGDDTQ